MLKYKLGFSDLRLYRSYKARAPSNARNFQRKTEDEVGGQGRSNLDDWKIHNVIG